MYHKIFGLLGLLLLTVGVNAQSYTKKKLDIPEMISWKSIEDTRISNDGKWVTYLIQPAEGDASMVLYNDADGQSYTLERATQPQFSADSRFAVFLVKPPLDTLKAMRRRKVEDADLPKDTLGIYDLQKKTITKIARAIDYKLPEKWSGWLAYRIDPLVQDTTAGTSKKKKKKKKEETGQLTFRQLATGEEMMMDQVLEYQYAEEGGQFAFITQSKDSALLSGVYLFETGPKKIMPLFQAKGKYPQLAIDKSGARLAFVVDTDTTKAQIRPHQIYHWQRGNEKAALLAGPAASILPENWVISPHQKLQFAEDGSRLFFGIAPAPIVEDTSLLSEEIVKVEVWTAADPRLYTQQNVLKEAEKKRAYTTAYNYADQKLIRLATPDWPEVTLGNEGKATVALAYNEEPYLQKVSWEGFPSYKDLFLVDVRTGASQPIGTAVKGNPEFSPDANYVHWYSPSDTAWYAYSVATKNTVQLTDNQEVAFYDELNDQPIDPDDYGVAGWLEGDSHVLIYDRYDLWKIDPTGKTARQKLTDGRKDKRRYQYQQLDREQRFIKPDERILLHFFDEETKAEGYSWLQLGTNKLEQVQVGNYHLTRPLKAKDAGRYVFTREDFQLFPDLLYSADLKQYKKISDANPQQKDYRWGTIELYNWTDLNGQPLQGLLVKPEGFDPKKKYPVIVNFYERSTDGLYRHRAPEAHRSSINYSFYASRGYVIFNPDVPYRIGYPGESAYNSVISGISSLIDKGFVDQENIGIQGHSWGGYQAAYLLTKTDLFKCAESGAPVVNMISAYGGIRWGTGLSRMFQYEHTQSRIGGTLWEYPLRYIENSPIFFTDKINTPVLILHNDNDSAVPWYQGIEWFVALRRLGKPAWMLNYNDEPHWPVKLQNRKDFQKRMAQFFDYYLQGAPQPMWMQKGVSPLEKGINQGYEAAEKE